MGAPGESRAQLPWGRALATSASSTVNLVVAGCAGLSAAALHSAPLLGLGALAFGALVAWDLTQPSFWKKVIRGSDPARPALPRSSDLTDPATRRAVESLTAAKQELARVLAEGPEQVDRYLALALSV